MKSEEIYLRRMFPTLTLKNFLDGTALTIKTQEPSQGYCQVSGLSSGFFLLKVKLQKTLLPCLNHQKSGLNFLKFYL